MLGRRWSVAIGATLLVTVALPGAVLAQGTTTGAIGGLVTDSAGAPIAAAQVQIVNRSTGYTHGVITRENGRYLVQGLEVGGPYTVTARRIGFQAATRDNVQVSLSQTTEVNLRLTAQVAQLSGVQVVATTSDFSPTRKGIETTVIDSVISRIPTLNRDFTDLVKLTPQVVSGVGGIGPSAAGAYNRYNNFTIDGANQNDRFGLASSDGVPGGANGGRLISIDAVKEFQVLLTPADVRHGNFAGMIVNAVTKGGTNTFSGGATYAYRNPQLAANEPFLRNSDFKVHQYGFYLGGPIVKDRLHFFIAPEFQSRSQPATGPYVGQSTPDPGFISPDTLARIASIMAPFFPVGSTGLVSNENPLTNLSGRVDWQIASNHRLMVRQLYNHAKNDAFTRNARTFNPAVGNQNSGFRLTSNAFTSENRNSSTVAQLFSYFGNGSSNEFLAGYNYVKDERLIPIRTPEISVAVTPPGGNSPSAAVTFGTEEFSPGNLLTQKILEISDNYSMAFGPHTATVGARYEGDHIFNNFAQRSFGVYAFASVDALAAGTPLNYSLGYSNGGPIAADFRTAQWSLYAQDQWTVTDRFALTYGLRADIPHFLDRPVQNDTIAARFVAAGLPAVNTRAVPKTQVLWSPRVGFNWDPTGDQRNQVRGTVGVFTGPPPLILIGNAFANTGLGLVTLNCGGGANPPPVFTTDVNNLPHACAGQAAPLPGQAGTAGINITNADFKYPQNFTASLGVDRQLPADFILTLEGLYRKAINGAIVRDRNLKGPRLVGGVPYTDPNGRVLYADTIALNGTVTNTGQRVVTSLGTPPVAFTEGVIEVANESRDYSYSLTAQLRRRFFERLFLSGAYTYMRSYDLQSLTSDRAISNWRNGATFSGLERDLPLTTSVFERRHRATVSGTYVAPWKTTEISAYYNGSSGVPIVYTVNGDLNGDGFNGNDPIYIPKDAKNPAEIQIGNTLDKRNNVSPTNPWVYDPAMAAAFDKFISDNPCLNEQRGHIMRRNSCRTPWSQTVDLSLRQSIPEIAGQRVSVQLDIFNFGNLLNHKWGQQSLPVLSPFFPQQQILQLRGRAPGPLDRSLSFFTFNSQVQQLGAFTKSQLLASNFYQMQLTLKYQF